MRRHQTIPRQWFIVTVASDLRDVGRLQAGTGLLLLGKRSSSEMRRLRMLARNLRLEVVHEGRRSAVRVHDLRELRRALLDRTPMVLLSPLYPTRSHPEWKPLPRMRAAALARLADGRLIALGGMDAKRYAKLEALGFTGWAGISAFRT